MQYKTKKVAIVGAGIVGSSAAFYLSQVTGIELDIYDEGVGQATSAAAGIISPWLSRRRNKKWYRLVKQGAAMYPDFLKETGIDIDHSSLYRKTGVLIFKKTTEKLKDVTELALKRREDSPEIGDVTLLDAQDIRKLIPIYEGSASALFVSGGSRVDGAKLVQHLRSVAEKNGAAFYNQKVRLEEGREKPFLIDTDQGKKEYDAVVLAVGAWLPNLLKPLGYSVDIRPQKGQLAELQIPQTETADWPVVMPEGEKDILFFPDGRVVIGATHQDDSGYDLSIEEQLLQPMIQEASQNFSSVFSHVPTPSYRVGTRAYTSDYASFIGEVPGMNAVYTASGLGSTGLTAGPLVGKLLSQLVLGEEPDLPLEDYPISAYIQKSTPAQPLL